MSKKPKTMSGSQSNGSGSAKAQANRSGCQSSGESAKIKIDKASK